MFNSSNKSLRRQMTSITLQTRGSDPTIFSVVPKPTQLDESQKENPQHQNFPTQNKEISSKADYMAQ